MADSKAVPAFDAAPSPAPSAAAQDWRRGWPVVLAGACGYMLISLGMLSMGAFMRCDRGETPTDHHTLFLMMNPAGVGFLVRAARVFCTKERLQHPARVRPTRIGAVNAGML